MQPITHHMDGRNNNFNLLRLLAAVFIAYYHCYFMALGPEMTDDRYKGLYELSQIALNFFFVTSGFLIALSFTRRSSMVTYIAARVLRLIPGIFVLSVLIAFVMGPLVTEVSLGSYFSALDTWLYVPLTTLLQPDRTLPGVFTSNINPIEIDDALWTLRYEVICYVALAIIGLLGFLSNEKKFLFLSIAGLLAYALISYATNLRGIAGINHLLHFGLSFFIGTAFYIYRDRIPLNGLLMLVLIGLAGLTYYIFEKEIAEPLIIFATAYAVFWLAYIPGGFIRKYNQLGDYSYGVYIYHYPIEQMLMHYFGDFSPLTLFLTALPLSFICAVISWYVIEKPGLDLLPKFKSLNQLTYIKQN